MTCRRIALSKVMNRPRGPGAGNLAKGRSMLAAKRRERMRHVERILARVWQMHPDDARARAKRVETWARILWANDPFVARALREEQARRAA